MNLYNNNSKPCDNSPNQISGIVDNLVKSLGLSKPYYGWKIVSSWSEIAGKTVAKISNAERFDNGILYISVPDSIWRQELHMKNEDILNKIHSFPYGKVVNKIIFTS